MNYNYNREGGTFRHVAVRVEGGWYCSSNETRKVLEREKIFKHLVYNANVHSG